MMTKRQLDSEQSIAHFRDPSYAAVLKQLRKEKTVEPPKKAVSSQPLLSTDDFWDSL